MDYDFWNTLRTYIYWVPKLIHNQEFFSNIYIFINYSLQAQIVTLKGGVDSKQYRHNQQLEELRNLQDKLSMEKAAWTATKDQETRELEEKKAELMRLQVFLKFDLTPILSQY